MHFTVYFSLDVCHIYRQNTVVKSTTINQTAVGTDDGVPPVDFGKMDNRLPLKIQDSERTEYVSPVSCEYYSNC